jgi:hypothetical protein
MSKQLQALYKLESSQSANAVGKAVMAALGRPADFLRVTSRLVTADGHRVNVIAGSDPTTARIAHSFFVTADEAGNLTGSAPPIFRLY